MFMCTDHTSLSSQVHRYPNSIWIKWLRLGCKPFLHSLPLLMCHLDVIWAMLILWLLRICWSNLSFTCMHIESPPKPHLKLSAHFLNFLQTHKHSSAHVVITILHCYFSKNNWKKLQFVMYKCFHQPSISVLSASLGLNQNCLYFLEFPCYETGWILTLNSHHALLVTQLSSRCQNTSALPPPCGCQSNLWPPGNVFHLKDLVSCVSSFFSLLLV